MTDVNRFVEKEANTKLALKKSSLRRKGLMTMGNCDVPLRWEALGERTMIIPGRGQHAEW